jgi:hypothetical protein
MVRKLVQYDYMQLDRLLRRSGTNGRIAAPSIRTTLDSLEERQQTHVGNLESALQIIAQVGIMYKGLERDDQRELVERVIHCRAGRKC